MQANNEPTQRTTVNAEYFELFVLMMQTLMQPLDFKKKFRIVLEHDPDEAAIEVQYFIE